MIGTSGDCSPPSGSVGEVAVATFTTSDPSPAYPGSSRARNRKACSCPGARSPPPLQVTRCPAAEQAPPESPESPEPPEPPGPLESTKASCAGRSSTAPTSRAVDGPAFRAVTVYSTSSPGETRSGLTLLPVDTWAIAVTGAAAREVLSAGFVSDSPGAAAIRAALSI